MHTRGAAFLIAAALILHFIACKKDSSESAGLSNGGEPVNAVVWNVRAVRVPNYSTFPGTVISADRVAVASRMTGYVSGLTVHEGQKVKKGRLLFTIDPAGVEAEIQQARAELAKAEANLTAARAKYDRYQQLYRQKSVSPQEFEDIKVAWEVALRNRQAAEAALKLAQSHLKYAEVHSPLDGVVVTKSVENGQLATAGHPLLTLESPGRLQVEVQVADEAYHHLRLGQEVPVRFEDRRGRMRTVNGAVERLVPAANPATHTHLVKIGIPSGTRVNSGQYALVGVPVGERGVIVVPYGAIHNRAGIDGVFVLGAGDRARFRMVTPGEEVFGGRAVLSGLFTGERVIVSAEGPLANGVRINPLSGTKK